MLLSLLGALCSACCSAFWGVRGLVASLPANVPRADEIRVDGAVLAFTVALAVLTGLALRHRPRLEDLAADELAERAARGAAAAPVGPAHHRLRNTLVVAEISLALILLVGAGLLLRSFVRVLTAPTPASAPTASSPRACPCRRPRFPEHAKRAAFVRARRGAP